MERRTHVGTCTAHACSGTIKPMEPTNKAAMQKWVCSLPSKELGDLLHFAFQEKARRKKAAKKLEKSRLARKNYEANKLKDKTDNILIDDNIGKSLVK